MFAQERRSQIEENGADEGTRTPDPRITNALLYQLSYIGSGPCLYYKSSRDKGNLQYILSMTPTIIILPLANFSRKNGGISYILDIILHTSFE